ncbi:MAG TPA: T9SS type A sorting domain-containing protein, partial [Bacteroidota bacterium]
VSLSQLKMYATAEVVSETLNSAPREFSLLQNYPNPFNATTTFSFSIAETRTVSLKIYDIQGREIETVLESELQPDTYKIPWQARAYASGIYFFRLIAGSYVSTIKLVIVK